jgi:putative endonuclease
VWAGGTLQRVEKRRVEAFPRYVESMKLYYVYILASLRRILYIGITGNLETRLAYHRALENPTAFTTRYGITRLVYFEDFTDVNQAIDREKQLKGWRRAKKIRLIETMNPDWVDLAPESVPPAHTGPSLRSG